MSSWPPTLVDWGELTPRLRDGATVCLVHGLVDAEQAPIGIPICPHCRQAVTLARRDREGVLREFVEPRPPRCAAAEQHPLAPGRTLVGWTSCGCPAGEPRPGRTPHLALPRLHRAGPRARRRRVPLATLRPAARLSLPTCRAPGTDGDLYS